MFQKSTILIFPLLWVFKMTMKIFQRIFHMPAQWTTFTYPQVHEANGKNPNVQFSKMNWEKITKKDEVKFF